MDAQETAALERMKEIVTGLDHIGILQMLAFGEGLAAARSNQPIQREVK